MNFRAISQIQFVILSLVALASCVGNVQKPNPSYYENLVGNLEVIQVSVERPQRDANGKIKKDSEGKPIVDIIPISEQMRVNPDEEIRITFNRKIDSYSARPENFELFTDEGARVPGNVTPNSIFVNDPSGATNPDGTPVKVSQLKLRPPTRFFLPKRRYFLIWRAAPEADSQAEKELPGIRDDSGTVPLMKGSTTFLTSDQYSDSALANLKIRSMSPGKIISGGGSASFKDALKNDVKDEFPSYTTWVANSPIRVLFTEPIRHLTETAQQVQRPDIPPTDISQFPGMIIGVLNSNTLTANFFENMNEGLANPSAWTQFVQQNFYQTLQGKVHTEGGRRVLAFELNQGATYPDDIAQGIVVIIQGWADLESHGGAVAKTLENNGVAVGAFIHLSGLTLKSGFDDPRDILKKFLGGGGNP